ncbi:MAG TPA: YciK family oxidoreductase [Pseudomonadales bacterium]|jgi:NAD(P)-dependent dehydrogenase (short-subunit alcohol dehydrogenase family)|nr:YciK family oxidoreductase [Pseudomonadales bacterium]HNI37077.1 YciK family oxidoreductase [Pseudomonadales bacterium]
MKSIHTLPAGYSPRTDLLAERVILVTGAGDGIGRAAAHSFAAHGATVILLGKTQEKLEWVYDEILAAGHPEPMILPLDLQYLTPDTAQAIADTIGEELGRLDGLLHNAALLGTVTPIADYSPERWQQVMQVNVHAAFLLTKTLLPLLTQAPDASILFTTSSVGRQGRAFWGAYAVSKFAVEGMMETLADELEEVTRVRVNAINPGGTRTRMRAAAYPGENPNTRPAADSLMPLYLYLMGPDSDNITGRSFDAQPST